MAFPVVGPLHVKAHFMEALSGQRYSAILFEAAACQPWRGKGNLLVFNLKGPGTELLQKVQFEM